MVWGSVAAGTELYGAVRKVDTTPIITKFAMLQFFPLFPVESYYLYRVGPEQRDGVPLIFGTTSKAIVGLRLARVNRLSATIAYLRAIGAAVGLFGVTGVVMWIALSFSMPMKDGDPIRRYWLPVASTLVVTGIVISMPTYYFTYVVPIRDKSIRRHCGDVLGIAADPAHCELETARELFRLTRDLLTESGISVPKKVVNDPSLTDADQKRLLLVLARIMIAIEGRRDALERLTDSLLLQLSEANATRD